MPNGRTELDALGCEFGRALGKDVSYMRDDIAELKDDLKELIQTTKQIEKQISKDEGIRTLGMAGLSALVAAIVSKFWR
jgi:cell division protein FtsB